MWAFNKTGPWLAAKTEEERAVIIAQTQKDAPIIRATYRERQRLIAETRRQNLEKQRVETERRCVAKAMEVANISSQLEAQGGLWESNDEVDEGLRRLKTTKKSVILQAIKVQLLYRRKVKNQKITDTKLWNFSEAGVAFPPDQMITKLKSVIRQSR